MKISFQKRERRREKGRETGRQKERCQTYRAWGTKLNGNGQVSGEWLTLKLKSWVKKKENQQEWGTTASNINTSINRKWEASVWNASGKSTDRLTLRRNSHQNKLMNTFDCQRQKLWTTILPSLRKARKGKCKCSQSSEIGTQEELFWAYTALLHIQVRISCFLFNIYTICL